MKPLLIEIGSEEIPARFISRGLALLRGDLVQLLEKSSITYGNISEYSTPRRLAILIDNVAELQNDRTIESLGPPKKSAYDANGNPTKAALGFAKSLNIGVEDLRIINTERGEYVSATVTEIGRPTADVLSESLPKLISSLQLPKSMRWGDSSLKYFRPIQWILALLGSEVIPFALDSIKSGNISYGHRFLSPAALKIDSPSSYSSSLKQNHVYADTDKRKDLISEGIQAIEASADCIVHKDAELLDTVTNLVEYPTAVLGNFDTKFLDLPRELLITVMRTHQKYFSVEDRAGNMKSSFIVISNMNKEVNDTVRRGAERVLRARLEDARFYYTEDQKCSMHDYMEGLKKVTFQEKLGSLYEKTERVCALSSVIAEMINPDLKDKSLRASMLCKADLVTGVVGEFPELQGYMGMIYAGKSGEDKAIASAIYEHYLPRFAGDSLPSGEIGTIVSMSDKFDNIASFFYLGMIPSGSEDPFALRRQAAGILNILQSNDYAVTLNWLIDKSLIKLEPSEPKRAVLADMILQFFNQRLEGILLSQGHSHDVINAALSVTVLNLTDIQKRIQALSALKKEPGFPALLTAAKRVYNILAKVRPGDVKENLLSEPSETELYGVIGKVRADMMTATGFDALFKLEKPVNTFFDSVLVMDKDPHIRENRLALLNTVKELFNSLADFSKVIE
ncbi:MAG: glycine--tRNA ligase subunit beta [Nitrospiraceae bacterium]|nr:MAG: glycine--tRNA ligase subunit beta [Nitrospiraceae bacterium]